MRTHSLLAVLTLTLMSTLCADAQVRRISLGAGAIKGNTYSNPSIGVSCQFPAGWHAVAEAPPATLSKQPILLLMVEPPEGRSASGLALWITPLDRLAEPLRDPRAFLPDFLRTKNKGSKDASPVMVGEPTEADLDQRPFIRANVQTRGPAGYFAIMFAGRVNGFMLVFEVTARTLDEAKELAESIGGPHFSPPDDPDDVPGTPIIIDQRPDTMKRIQQSESVARARVRAKVDPEYPAEARDRGVEGEVLIAVIVGANGNVAEASVISGHPLLNDAALEAVKQWKFEPVQIDGAPVETETRIRMRFSLISAKQKS